MKNYSERLCFASKMTDAFDERRDNCECSKKEIEKEEVIEMLDEIVERLNKIDKE